MIEPNDTFIKYQTTMLSEYFTSLGTELIGQQLTAEYASELMVDINILLAQFIGWLRND